MCWEAQAAYEDLTGQSLEGNEDQINSKGYQFHDGIEDC